MRKCLKWHVITKIQCRQSSPKIIIIISASHQCMCLVPFLNSHWSVQFFVASVYLLIPNAPRPIRHMCLKGKNWYWCLLSKSSSTYHSSIRISFSHTYRSHTQSVTFGTGPNLCKSNDDTYFVSITKERGKIRGCCEQLTLYFASSPYMCVILFVISLFSHHQASFYFCHFLSCNVMHMFVFPDSI